MPHTGKQAISPTTGHLKNHCPSPGLKILLANGNLPHNLAFRGKKLQGWGSRDGVSEIRTHVQGEAVFRVAVVTPSIAVPWRNFYLIGPSARRPG